MNSMNRKIISTLETIQPTPRAKTTFLQFDNYSVNANGESFSNAFEIGTDIKSISICGYQGTTTPDGTSHVELWIGDEDQSSSFLSPLAVGHFSNGLLYFGQTFIDSKFVKLRLVNNHSTSTTFTIRYYLSN